MATGGTVAWHNRNRTLLSEYGRFAQRDPNASGQGVSSAATAPGRVAPSIGSADGVLMFGDGFGLYTYTGSSPMQRQDPSGLFFGGILGLFAPTTGMDIYGDYNQSAAEAGGSMSGFVTQDLAAYGVQQLDMIEAIMDWDESDAAFDSVTAGGAGFGEDPYFAGGGTFAGSGYIMAGGRRPGISGKRGERALRLQGAKKGYPVQVPGFPPNQVRVFDGVKGSSRNKIGMESKVGRVSMRSRIKRQIAKDKALIESGKWKVEWYFYKSSYTGRHGATQQVLDALKEAGITVKFAN